MKLKTSVYNVGIVINYVEYARIVNISRKYPVMHNLFPGVYFRGVTWLAPDSGLESRQYAMIPCGNKSSIIAMAGLWTYVTCAHNLVIFDTTCL
jgi:hypothetical protein